MSDTASTSQLPPPAPQPQATDVANQQQQQQLATQNKVLFLLMLATLDITQQLMHKNRLQEFTQRSSLPLPIYHTVSEGAQHAPKFRSTVLVAGAAYTSPDTFSHRKAAEQDVARLALDGITKKIKNEGCPLISQMDSPVVPTIKEEELLNGAIICQWAFVWFRGKLGVFLRFMRSSPGFIHFLVSEIRSNDACVQGKLVKDLQDTVFCKSILNEYAMKINKEKPTYDTVQSEGLLPIFVCSLVFDGVSYTGEPGKSKKEAEQLAARSVILSILGNPSSGTLLSEIIMSKLKLYAALHKVKESQQGPNTAMTIGSGPGHVSGNSEMTGHEGHVIIGTYDMTIAFPAGSSSYTANVPVVYQPPVSNNLTATGLPQVTSIHAPATNQSQPTSGDNSDAKVHQPQHEFRAPKSQVATEEITPIQFVPPSLDQSRSGPTSGKKRNRKNKKKTKKKMKLNAE
ncbi:Double-stranded RNA-binding domain [Dillenia turbinata]|uniref:Double-stranded RNA-binding domain n=1 Tax=Dillenia turbinata TaxID=194707 RepID=A0AAN8YV48_9MAGN